jgi:hypothetical protein
MPALPYQKIRFDRHVSKEIVSLVRDVIDPFLSEFRFLLTVQHPEQGEKGSLQRPLASLLLASIDGAAQFLQPGSMNDGKRFQRFLRRNCPWELDKPRGLTVEEACEFLWNEARCPMLHRFGVRSNKSKHGDPRRVLKFGRAFALNDADVTRHEMSWDNRPFTEPSIKRDTKRTVLWIEPFYWSLRIAIQRSVDTPSKSANVTEWLTSGRWDPSTEKFT